MLDRKNLRRAWKRVRANRGAPGVDGVSVEDFRELTRERWPEIYQVLLEGTYQPQPVRRVQIEKEDGGYRLLGVPTVLIAGYSKPSSRCSHVMKTVGPPYSGKLNVRWDGKGMVNRL